MLLHQRIYPKTHPAVSAIFLQLIPLYFRLGNGQAAADTAEKLVLWIKSATAAVWCAEIIKVARGDRKERGAAPRSGQHHARVPRSAARREVASVWPVISLSLAAHRALLKSCSSSGKSPQPVAWALSHALGCAHTKICSDPAVPGVYLKSALDLATKSFGRNSLEAARVRVSLGELAQGLSCGTRLSSERRQGPGAV